MIETERLIHRKFTFDDLPRLIETRSDPEVYKYLGGIERQNPKAITKRMRFYLDCYEKYGFGMCALVWKETGEIIGSSGLQPLDGTDEIEIGYSMIKEFWRKGIGFETARGWLDFGFNQKNLDRIVAVASPENTGSWRIMKKCGMKYEKAETHYGMECVFYSITKEEFQK